MSTRPDPEQQAGQVVTGYLRRHLEALTEQDARLRQDKPSAINQMRIEARRLRSGLTTYRTLFTPGSVEPLRTELRWVGLALNSARDAQVLRARLAALVAAAPDDADLANLGRQIDERLRRDFLAGRAEGLAALAGERYRSLTEALSQFLADPPLTRSAARRADTVLARAIERDRHRLVQAVRAAESAAPEDRDAAFHEARKRTKRLRYGAEAASPVLGASVKRLVRTAKQVQDLLGERQDAVVAHRLVRGHGIAAGFDADSPPLSTLLRIESDRRDEREAEFLRVWNRSRIHAD